MLPCDSQPVSHILARKEVRMGIRKTLLGIIISIVFIGPVWAQGQQEYTFDTEHTRIGFSIRHVGIVPVKGSFTEYSGTFIYDENSPTDAVVDVTITAASIDTGVERRDNHLRNADFFDVETYPEITFQSTRFEQEGDQLQAVGTLTMHGISKEITIPFTVTGELLYPNSNIIYRGVEGRITLNRTEFGIGSQQAFLQLMKNGSAWASEDVEITLDIMWERRIPYVANLLKTTIEEEGVDAALAQFDELYAEYYDKEVYSFSVNPMSRIAKAFLEEGKTREAVELHKLNVRMQPDWWWLYTPLAEAYEAHGDPEQAIVAYRKVLEFNPEDEEATAALKRLGEE